MILYENWHLWVFLSYCKCSGEFFLLKKAFWHLLQLWRCLILAKSENTDLGGSSGVESDSEAGFSPFTFNKLISRRLSGNPPTPPFGIWWILWQTKHSRFEPNFWLLFAMISKQGSLQNECWQGNIFGLLICFRQIWHFNNSSTDSAIFVQSSTMDPKLSEKVLHFRLGTAITKKRNQFFLMQFFSDYIMIFTFDLSKASPRWLVLSFSSSKKHLYSLINYCRDWDSRSRYPRYRVYLVSLCFPL